jgi:tRNA splicing ligase
LSKRDPLDRTKQADYAIDKVLSMNLFDSSFANLENVCKELSWDFPQKENLDNLFWKLKEEREEFKLSSAKKIKARYYAIHIKDDILSFLDSSFESRPQDLEFWKRAKERILADKVFHVTLGVRNVHKLEYSFYDKNHVALQEKKIDIIMTRVVWDEKAITIQVKLGDDIKCGNQYPHITIATLEDSVESRYSNELIASDPETQFEIPDRTVCGKIEPFY